jgi:branched-chain amino acid transport system ATP-binding protein
LLYTEYLMPIQIAAAILLVAMIAAIALTLRERKDSKAIDPSIQVRVRAADRMRAVHQSAERAIELAGLQDRRHAQAGATSHGEQRQLEIAMTLATDPRVLLLDEPLAGMGQAEAERMVQLLLRLKKDHAILLVEHDMDAIFRIADYITVMVNGGVIATDTPEQVRLNPTVQAAYLGEH